MDPIESKRPTKTDPKFERNSIQRSFDRVVGCWESSQTHATFQRVVTRLVPCCACPSVKVMHDEKRAQTSTIIVQNLENFQHYKSMSRIVGDLVTLFLVNGGQAACHVSFLHTCRLQNTTVEA